MTSEARHYHASVRVLCLVTGHRWAPAAEALDPDDVAPLSVAYAGDGDDTVVLVCRRCSHSKAVSVRDFHRFTGGVTGYGEHDDA
jgi:hypothetical protein